MNQHPLLPLLQPRSQEDGAQRETEQQMFERIAATMRDDQRRARRAQRVRRARRQLRVEDGSRRAA
jgi:hypothetical protein